MEDSSSEHEDENDVDEVIDLTNEDDDESSKEDDSSHDENMSDDENNESRREDDLSIQYISSGEDDGSSDDERYMVSDDDDSGDDDADDGYDELLNDYEDVNRRPYMVRWMVETNDPKKLELCIHKRSLPIDGSLDEEHGAHIGRNTSLRQLKLARPNLKLQFFQGMALNRSIMKLSLIGRYQENDEILSCLIPFFKNNHAFECLHIKVVGRGFVGTVTLRMLASTLMQFHSLKEFKFCDGNTRGNNRTQYGRNAMCNLIKALTSHADMRKITLCGLHQPMLQICHDRIGDTRAVSLSSGNSPGINSLRALNLVDNCVGENGWHAISRVLASSKCKLRKLNLSYSHINDSSAIALASALLNCSTLTTLNLALIEDITILGKRPLLLGVLESHNCVLERICLRANGFVDDLIRSLKNALVNNSRLRELDLSCNQGVTPAGWQTFVSVLRNPDSSLDRLVLYHNRLGDEAMFSFAAALASNRKLRELIFLDGDMDPTNSNGVSHIGYDAFTHTLCDKSSIVNTYHSNHTLEKLCGDNFDFAGNFHSYFTKLSCLLQINSEHSCVQAARIKIIMTHFSGSIVNTQVFNDIGLTALPTAIAWMGRGVNNERRVMFNLLLEVMRMMPSLCDTKGKNGKRIKFSLSK